MKLGSMMRGVLASAEQVAAAQERKTLALDTGLTPIIGAQDRTRGTYGGIVRSIVIRPRGGTPALEIELYDGSGALDIVFLGRRQIAGIEPGSRMRATGLIHFSDGRPIMFNPRYELKAKTGGNT